MMNYAGLRAEQKRLREQGIYRGIGFACFIEVTNPSAAFYGVGGARISSQDGATVKLDAQGNDHRAHRRHRAGPGRRSGDGAGASASSFGVPIEQRARRHRRHRQHALWRRHLGVARGRHRRRSGLAGRQGAARQCAGGRRRDAAGQAETTSTSATASSSTKTTGTERLPLDELARVAYFRPDTLPPGFQAELMATRHYVPRAWPFAFTNGMQASYLEVDTDTGFVKLLKHWCVEDCGTIINPQLVDEQIRGGVVQGIGAALFEHCLYDERGQMLNGNMADYLVPMAAEMPDIEVRPRGVADRRLRARRQGRRRSRHRRRAGLRDERHQRRAAPARRAAAHRHAVHAGQDSARAGEGVSCSSA